MPSDGFPFDLMPTFGHACFAMIATAFVIVGGHIGWCLLTDEDDDAGE